MQRDGAWRRMGAAPAAAATDAASALGLAAARHTTDVLRLRADVAGGARKARVLSILAGSRASVGVYRLVRAPWMSYVISGETLYTL